MHLTPRRFALFIGLCALSAACAGPRMRMVSDREFRRRPSIYPIETYVGSVAQSHHTVAILDSSAFPVNDGASKEKMLTELKGHARDMGADAVHEIHLLTKKIRGYTPDERAPILSWKQGEYPLYFLRGTAIRYDSGMPGAVARGEGFTAGPEGYTPTEDEQAEEKKDLQTTEKKKEEKGPKGEKPKTSKGKEKKDDGKKLLK